MQARKLTSENEKGDKTADIKESQRILRTHFKRKSILHQMKSLNKRIIFFIGNLTNIKS